VRAHTRVRAYAHTLQNLNINTHPHITKQYKTTTVKDIPK
jgi:hypothetical protein